MRRKQLRTSCVRRLDVLREAIPAARPRFISCVASPTSTPGWLLKVVSARSHPGWLRGGSDKKPPWVAARVASRTTRPFSTKRKIMHKFKKITGLSIFLTCRPSSLRNGTSHACLPRSEMSASLLLEIYLLIVCDRRKIEQRYFAAKYAQPNAYILLQADHPRGDHR